MKIGLSVIVGLLLLGTVSYADNNRISRCPAGQAKGFVSIHPDPNYLVGTIPSVFTDRARYFIRRYNCKGASAQVRRVSLGIYDVRFPFLDPRTAVATATSDEGITASVLPLGDGIVRVALRGPLGGADVATRRDVPFSLIVY